MSNLPLDSHSEDLINKIIQEKKEGLDFLKQSDEIDFKEKVENSGLYFVSVEEISVIHQKLGFSKQDLIRPILLESAAQRPVNIFLYKNESQITLLASELCYGIVQNHPFIDGNKRVSMITLCYFLEKNHLFPPKDSLMLANLILKLAQHTINAEDLNNFLIAK